MSVAVEIIEQGLQEVMAQIQALNDPVTRLKLMTAVGQEVQDQTEYRITTEKTAPDGTAWPPNRRGTSTLYASGTLAGSIDYRATPDEVHVGSPLPYARIHQFGGVITPRTARALAFSSGGNSYVVKSVYVPPRPYLGLSAQNVSDIEGMIADFVADILAGIQ